MTAQMLHHGTSTPRLKLILEENCLRRQGFRSQSAEQAWTP